MAAVRPFMVNAVVIANGKAVRVAAGIRYARDKVGAERQMLGMLEENNELPAAEVTMFSRPLTNEELWKMYEVIVDLMTVGEL
jgi:hypothetical protein